MNYFTRITCLAVTALLCVAPAHAKKKILFLAGPPSHANGEHEFRAGCMLLADALNESGLEVDAKVHWYGWPKDESIFEGVDACIIYADAGGRLGNKVEFLDQKVKAGMGIMFMHYGVHPSKEVGEKYFQTLDRRLHGDRLVREPPLDCRHDCKKRSPRCPWTRKAHHRLR